MPKIKALLGGADSVTTKTSTRSALSRYALATSLSGQRVDRVSERRESKGYNHVCGCESLHLLRELESCTRLRAGETKSERERESNITVACKQVHKYMQYG